MKPAHPTTVEANARVATELDFTDRGDFEDAQRAIRLNGPKAQDVVARFDWNVAGDRHRLTLSNGALNHLPGSHGPLADAVVWTERAQLGELSRGAAAFIRALDSGALKVDGNRKLFRAFVEALDEFDPMFNVVEP